MERVTNAPQLRSLRIGEIFDRATTFYVQNFAAFLLIVLTVLLPFSIVQYLLLRDQPADFTQLLRQIQHPGSAPVAQAPYGITIATLLLVFASVLLAPYVNNAIAVGVGMLYRGEQPAYRPAFARVFARGWQLLGTIVLCVLVFLAAYVGIVILLGIVGVGFAMAFGVRSAVAVAAIILGMIVVLLAIALIVLACIFACYATTLEGVSAGTAISQAFSRLFSRREFPKALLMVLSYIALEIAVLLILGLIEVPVDAWTHSRLLQSLLSTVGGSVLNGYVAVLGAVYYFDVLTRVEGLDLEVDFARLPGAP